MSKSRKLKFVFTTGMTGGHIFPVLSLAYQLKKDGHKIYIVSSGSIMEKKVIDQKDFSIYTLKVSRLGKGVSFLERFKTICLLPYFMICSFFILRKIKPDIVMGSGGSVCGPVLLVGSWMGYFTAVWEFNVVCGLTNRILSLFVDQIFIHFEETKKNFPKKKCFIFSFPVREDILEIGSKKREPDGYSHLFILGGSQGAHRINQAVLDMYHRGLPETWKILHQTGEKDLKSIQSIYSKNKQAQCQAFIQDMGKCYQWADIVVSRAGAGVLSELSACGKASIIIPHSSSDQHQYKNALALFQKEAIEMILEKDLSGELLLELVMKVQGRRKRQMEENIKKNYNIKSFKHMQDHLLNCVK